MEFAGVKAACFVLAILTFIQWASSQTTAAPDYIGFGVEEGFPVNEAWCGMVDMIVHTHSEFLFCDYPSSSRVGTACDSKGNVLYNTEIQDIMSTRSCDSGYPCVSVTVEEFWPGVGATHTMVDCMLRIGLDTPVSTLYRSEPTDLPSGLTEAVSTTLQVWSSVLGFVVGEGSPITTVSCAVGFVAHTYSGFIFCDSPEMSRVGTACDSKGNVLYTEIQDIMSTSSCRDSCISITVVEDWPNDGATYTVVECMDWIFGLDTPMSTLYQNKPTDLPSGFTESEFPEPTTDSETSWNSPTEESDDKRKGGVSKVGIAVGAVFAGVGLIIAAIFLGNRIRRKNAESSESGSQPRGHKGSGERLKPLSRPKEAGRRQENLTMQPTGTDSAPSEMEAKSKNSLVEMEARIEENLRAELGTGKDAQGWAGGGTNAVPYELDATTPADVKTK